MDDLTRITQECSADLRFRPETYFWPLPLETHLLARVKGAARRSLLRALLDGQERVPTALASAALDESERLALGRLHPGLMGGEYLPNPLEREVEIARITIASTTQDVTSVRARRGKTRIYYRVVDEYDGLTLSGNTSRTSTRPLSLGDLELFLNRAWSIFDVLEMNFGHEARRLEDMLQFVAVESQFYPRIHALYQSRITAWARAPRPETADTV